MAQYRSLSAEEIASLKEQGCRCDNWSNVNVAESFNASAISSTTFSGQIRLGVFENEVTFCGAVRKPCGISNATIHNCTIGDNVYIDQIRNYIANYEIASDVVIENVDLLAVDGQTTFGNGTQVAVLNEEGGREIPIYDNLSAHTAYLIALYRHRPKLIENLQKMIADYTASVRSSTGKIGRESKLINCRTIKNVNIGPSTTIEGIDRLENGSVNSCPQDPVYIGASVIAEDFIACSGSRITGGAIISKCFIGQGTQLGKHYSAENSVFFANCGGFHGEATSVFAGPFTVTYHKSTLLIAGLFSFLNAGSGSNQSNHMYKLGPIHQGVVERGSKTTSDSYMLWPAKIGPFTLVMGRHYRNPDTSQLPFSYLIEHEDESILVPGVNLRSIGTIRDARKWPKRDRRKATTKLDCINFNLLSPYTIQKMLTGRKILSDLKKNGQRTGNYYLYKGVRIKKSSLEKGIEFYTLGIEKFLGNSLISRLKDKKFENEDQMRQILKPDSQTGTGKWIDLAGLIAPAEIVDQLLDDIEQDRITDLEAVAAAFKSMHANYYSYEWTWAIKQLEKHLEKTIDQITAKDLIEITENWERSVLKLDDMLYTDAQKEFGPTAQIGYGIDGDQTTMQEDFENVRGTFKNNSLTAEIQKHISEKTNLAKNFITQLTTLP